jgi:hypothetical protein
MAVGPHLRLGLFSLVLPLSTSQPFACLCFVALVEDREGWLRTFAGDFFEGQPLADD